jgi:hypothetical protein
MEPKSKSRFAAILRGAPVRKFVNSEKRFNEWLRKIAKVKPAEGPSRKKTEKFKGALS